MPVTGHLTWESVPVDLTWHVVDEGEVAEVETSDPSFEEEASEKGFGASSGGWCG